MRKAECVQNLESDMSKKPEWTDTDLKEAELIHGPDSMNSDTYRLHIPGENDKRGRMLDVPGWMVGDQEGAELRMRAAEVIRLRVLKP